MSLRISIGQYVPGDSPVHRLDARIKCACAFVLIVASLFVHTPAQLALATAMTGAVLAISRVPMGKVLASMRPIVAFLAFTSLFNVFWVGTGDVLVAGPLRITTDGAWAAILYTLRFALLVATGALLSITTTPTALTDAFDAALSPLARLGAPAHEWAMVLSLALRFVPVLADDASAVIDAQRARGASFDEGGPIRRIRALVPVLVPLFAGSLRHADGLSRALDARCYEGGAARSHWHERHVGSAEWTAVAVSAVYVITLLVLGVIA